MRGIWSVQLVAIRFHRCNPGALYFRTLTPTRILFRLVSPCKCVSRCSYLSVNPFRGQKLKSKLKWILFVSSGIFFDMNESWYEWWKSILHGFNSFFSFLSFLIYYFVKVEYRFWSKRYNWYIFWPMIMNADWLQKNIWITGWTSYLILMTKKKQAKWNIRLLRFFLTKTPYRAKISMKK